MSDTITLRTDQVTREQLAWLVQDEAQLRKLLETPTYPQDYTFEGVTLSIMWIKCAGDLDNANSVGHYRSEIRYWLIDALGSLAAPNITYYDVVLAAIFCGYNVFVDEEIRFSRHKSMDGKKPAFVSGFPL